MRHQNTLLHDVLKLVPWTAFDRSVERHEADRNVRTLSTKSQFVALLHAQLSGSTSLREIVTTMESHAPRLKHVSVEAPKRSTLADANALRPANVFAELFKADHLITDYRYLRWRHLALQDQVGLSEPRFAWPLAVPPDYSARA